MKRLARSVGGFTLIELLVVIVILAILAAILFPVFARAKEAAMKATAMGDVKQIFLGQSLYQEESDDRYVLYFSGFVPHDPSGITYYPPLSYWPQTISPYMASRSPAPAEGQLLIQDLSPVFCDPIKGRRFQNPTEWDLGNISSWGLSDDIVHWRAPQGQTPTYVSISGSEVAAPSDCVLMVETWVFWSPQHNLAGSAFASSYFEGSAGGVNGASQFLDSPYGASYRKTSASQPPDPKGRNVAAFCDGHARSLSTGSLTGGPEYWSATNTGQWP